MKNTEITKYIYRVEKLINDKFSIPSYIHKMIIEYDKAGHRIYLHVIYEDKIMRITPTELLFDAVERSRMKFKSYHLGDYDLVYYTFRPNIDYISKDATLNSVELMFSKRFNHEWYNILRPVILKTGLPTLKTIAEQRAKKVTIYPEKEKVFKSLYHNSLNNTRVAIIGQDPYPHKHANGIAFATDLKPFPKSLELLINAMSDNPSSIEGNLNHLLKQNVLLYNTALTVIKGTPGSHATLWHEFTRHVIAALTSRPNPIIFILLGSKAQSYKNLITENHKIFEIEHPANAARENREWYHNKVFSAVNYVLKSQHQKEIIWDNY